MTVTRFIWSALVLLIGSTLMAGAYWALLNVPESNLLALLLSTFLVIALVVVSGVTIALAVADTAGLSWPGAIRRAVAAMPLFVVGLVVFAALWFATTGFDDWWAAHRGEADAVALRYGGFTGTAPIHRALAWLSWLVRWVIGLSVVLGLVAAATTERMTAAVAGFRLSVRPWPLLAATLGVLAISQVVWPLTPWRPERLPPTQTEVYFAGAKLGVLFLFGLLIATSVVAVFGRLATRSARH